MNTLGNIEVVPEPDREALVLTLTCLSKAIDRGDAELVRDLHSILQRLLNPSMRFQTGPEQVFPTKYCEELRSRSEPLHQSPNRGVRPGQWDTAP